MRTDELRTLLHDRGDEVVDDGAHARVGAVHERVRTVRRRRAAVAGGGLVAAVATVALVVVPGVLEPRTSGPAGSGPAATAPLGVSKGGVTYREEVLGEQLLGAAIGDPGETEVFLDVTVGREGLRFSPLCYGLGSDWTVDVSIEGHAVVGTSCDEEKQVDPGANGHTFDADPLTQLREWGLRPGDEATVIVALSPPPGAGGDEAGAEESAVVGVGVYEDTRPYARLAGVEVPGLIEWEGKVWQLAGRYESDAGQPSIWIERDPGDSNGPTLTVAAVSGLPGPARYTTLIDGEPHGTNEIARGVPAGPAWGTVGVLDQADEGFELELRVDQGLTDRTRLGFATYFPVG